MIFFRLKDFLKAHKWWDCQIALMMGVAYSALLEQAALPAMLPLLQTALLFLISSIGIAGFGYLFNDLHDRVQDERSGARNLLAGNSSSIILAKFTLVLVMGLLPWIWLRGSHEIWCVLAFQYFLFFIYSQPPIRLKSRGVFGVMADSTYAYVNSSVVAALLFSGLTQGHLPSLYLSLLIGWTFTMGLRQILFHQLVDANRDLADGISTFVVRYGAFRTFRLLSRVLIPGELLLFSLFLIDLGMSAIYIPLFFAGFTAYIYFRERKKWIWNAKNPFLLPPISLATLFTERVMDHFMMGWFPMLMLAPLCLRQPWYLVVTVIHYFIFENGPKRVINYDILPKLKSR